MYFSAAKKPNFRVLNVSKLILVVFAFLLSNPADARAQDDSIFSMSLEQLLSLKVSVTTRTEQSSVESASALYVIVQEDIKRSGARSIPEILRLVPGFHISRQDGNKWQINSRRNSNRFSNTMQVLMDGRTLYDSLFGGTYWEVQDTFIEDIERIEVIRGPGASTWGANSITGVINIITKSSNDTLGTKLVTGIGSGEYVHEVAIRHGFQGKKHATRFYLKDREIGDGKFDGINEVDSSNLFFPEGSSADDTVASVQGGFKSEIEWSDLSQLKLQGDGFSARTKDWRINGSDAFENDISMNGANFIIDLDTKYDESSSTHFRYTYDKFERTDSSFEYSRKQHELDFLFNHQFETHLFTFGVKYLEVEDNTNTPISGRFSLQPLNHKKSISSAVIQDQWTINKQWTLTTGARVDRDDQAGTEINPSVRALYKLNENKNLWFAFSRSARTPSRIEVDAYLDFNDFLDSPPFFSCPVDFGFTLDPIVGCIIPIGNKDAESNITQSLEFGLRQSFGAELSVDLALFFDQDEIPGTNSLNHFYGAELVVKHEPLTNWRLEYQLSLIEIDADKSANAAIKDTENFMLHFRSYFNINSELSLNSLLYVRDGKRGFKSKVRADLNLVWNFSDENKLTFGINHLGDGDKSQAFDPTRVNSVIETGYFAELSFNF